MPAATPQTARVIIVLERGSHTPRRTSFTPARHHPLISFWNPEGAVDDTGWTGHHLSMSLHTYDDD